MKTRRFVWIKSILVAGLLLAAFLLLESIVFYRYVSSHFLLDHLTLEASSKISLLEVTAEEDDLKNKEQLTELVNRFHNEHSEKIAWLRIANQAGDIIARSQGTSDVPLDENITLTLLEKRKQNVTSNQTILNGDVLVVVMPFRYRVGDERPASNVNEMPGRPKFHLVEIALYRHGATEEFLYIQRNLIASQAAALALVVSLVIIGLRIRKYVRGIEVGLQMELARCVQQELLPTDCPECSHLDIAAEFEPYWEVGGDYYDIFPTDSGNTVIVLGDVSGKGLAAALVAGVVHGAVRSVSAFSNGKNLGELAANLNELLLVRTAENRFVTLFWSIYEPKQQILHYVNAGHERPLLVRRNTIGVVETRRLSDGGPVVGLLPTASYEFGIVELQVGDLMVMCSDGLLEAINSSNTEFGEERLIHILETNCDRPSGEIRKAVLADLKEFIGSEPLRDDLTLLIVKIAS